MSILVVDVGTSSVRASIVRPDATVTDPVRRRLPPTMPAPGLVELDGVALAEAVLDTARRALEAGGPVEAVGITAQRASALAWRADGTLLGSGLGWQDLRTAGTCLELQGEGYRLSPSESATKWSILLDDHDPDRAGDVRLGTVDTWVAWVLTGGQAHVTDPTNAAVTGLWRPGEGWNTALAERLRLPLDALPTIVDSSGPVAAASTLDGAPPICGIAGDQQASLVGQGCLRPGLAKATFGTGAMLDLCTGDDRPAFTPRGENGCFPIVAWSRGGQLTWGVEAMALTAGSAVDWLVEDLGLLGSAAESAELAGSVADTDGVVVVPAFLGLATPSWDFGARATVSGLTRGSNKAHLVRAVLEGVAQQAADLVAAAEADSGAPIADGLRVDGGMTANDVFVRALADACGRPVEVSRELEATTLGAGFLAGLANGTWASEDEVMAAWAPRATIEPTMSEADRQTRRERWQRAVGGAQAWFPELTALQF